jgi:hypothetical protein
MTTDLVTIQHWRDRAEKARLHAQRMIEPVSKGMMVEVAEHYESLARRAGKIEMRPRVKLGSKVR